MNILSVGLNMDQHVADILVFTRSRGTKSSLVYCIVCSGTKYTLGFHTIKPPKMAYEQQVGPRQWVDLIWDRWTVVFFKAENQQAYPLVNVYITMENHHAING